MNENNFQSIIAEKTFNFDLVSILRGILGMAILLFIAWIFSSNRKAISWTTVVKGLLIQFFIAISVMFFGPVQDFFNFFGQCFVTVLNWTRAGSDFLFGKLIDMQSFGYIFAFQILPTIIFFSALTSLLFYLGIIQKIVWVFAWLMSRLMKLSGSESLATVGNVFLGQTESPLMIKPYIAGMSRSEIMLIMTAGMSTMAGGVLAAYIGMLGNGVPQLELEFARHLLSASVMAAPGAVVLSKILVPQTEKINSEIDVPKEKMGNNILDSISNGTFDGLKLAGNVAAMLLVFYALIAGLNSMLGFFGKYAVSELLFLFAGITTGIAGAYFLKQYKPRAMPYLFALAGFFVFLGLAKIYLSGKYADGALSSFVNMLDKVFALSFATFYLALGALIGAITEYALSLKNKVKTIRACGISFGIIAVIFIALACFFGFRTSVNGIVANLTSGQFPALSMQFVLGYIFSPVIWLMGIASNDVPLVGQLLGHKLILTEFVGYSELSKMISTNAFVEAKSAIMATYILCGFANFASVGIQIGGIGSIAPNQKSVLSAFGMRALLGGTLSALVSATMVGMII
jgi:nucleoside transporter